MLPTGGYCLSTSAPLAFAVRLRPPMEWDAAHPACAVYRAWPFEASAAYGRLLPIHIIMPLRRLLPVESVGKQGAEFVSKARPGIAGTITVQHLALNRNAIFRYVPSRIAPHPFLST